MDEYYFERLTPAHYIDLDIISKNSFGFKSEKYYYKKKNNTTSFGADHLGYIAFHSDTKEPAAFYGVYSYPLIYNGVSYKIVQSGDTMTHKSHSGKGLFTTLAKMTYSLAKNSGASAVFGFPNNNSYPGFVKKLNWKHRDNIKLYKIKVKTIPFLKLAKKILLFKKLYTLYSNFIFSFYQSDVKFFNNSNLESGKPVINHNISFFEYKSFSGNRIVKIGDLHVWIKPDGFLFIGDIENKTNSDFKFFLMKLKRMAILIGADVIQFGICPGGNYEKELNLMMQAENGAAFCYLMFSEGFPMSDFIYTQADLDTY